MSAPTQDTGGDVFRDPVVLADVAAVFRAGLARHRAQADRKPEGRAS